MHESRRHFLKSALVGSAVDLLSPNGGGTPAFVDAPLTITWRAKAEPGTDVRIQFRETATSPWQDITVSTMLPAPGRTVLS